MRRFPPGLAILAALAAGAALAESPASRPPLAPTGYADLADLGLGAPIAAHVRVVSAAALSKEQAAAARPGFALFYVEADLVSLIRAPQSLPTRISYLAEVPLGPGGKPAKPKKGEEMLIFARPVAGQAATVQLAAPDAAIPYSAADSERLRTMLRDSGADPAPPRITGIGKAFHVAGSLPGEGETQIFLQTADSRPVSLSVLRRPGEAMRWSVALSEIVDDAAAPPERDTLLWYRLACTLPPALPPQSLADASSPEEATAIREDYRFIIASLGPCGRTRRGSGG